MIDYDTDNQYDPPDLNTSQIPNNSVHEILTQKYKNSLTNYLIVKTSLEFILIDLANLQPKFKKNAGIMNRIVNQCIPIYRNVLFR